MSGFFRIVTIEYHWQRFLLQVNLTPTISYKMLQIFDDKMLFA